MFRRGIENDEKRASSIDRKPDEASLIEQADREPSATILSCSPYYKKLSPFLNDPTGLEQALLDEFIDDEDNYQAYYTLLNHLFLEDIDVQHGIIQNRVKDSHSTSGISIIRDATRAEKVGTPDTSPRVEANNTILRVLSRLRSLDFVLNQKSAEQDNAESRQLYQQSRFTLCSEFIQFVHRIYSQIPEKQILADMEFAMLDSSITNVEKKVKQSKSIHSNAEIIALLKAERKYQNKKKLELIDHVMDDFNSMEKAFNTLLCKVLHSAKLDQGCKKAKDYKELLFNLRMLSSLLEPAPSFITVTYDKENKVLYRIHQFPITRKTGRQKGFIKAEMKDNNRQEDAKQLLDYYFADLMEQDDRMLPPQGRDRYLPGVKNAYVVQYELIFNTALNRDTFLAAKANISNTSWLVRCASPVYVGGNQSDDDVFIHTKENLEQIRMTFSQLKQASEEQEEKIEFNPPQPKIHFTSLVTNSRFKHENRIVRHLSHTSDTFTNIAVNKPASYWAFFYPVLLSANHIKPILAHMMQQGQPSSERMMRHLAAAEDLSLSIQEGEIPIVGCAAGKDRTSTVVLLNYIKWVAQRYTEHQLHRHAITSVIAKSRNFAEIMASLMPGTRGGKSNAHVASLFSEEIDDSLYLKSAYTNRSNKINKTSLMQWLAASSTREEKQSHSEAQNSVVAMSCNPRPFR